MNKDFSIKRREAIKKILCEMFVSDQNTLVKLLANQFGITTNQSVLSRDLRKLGVIKKTVNNQLIYALPDFDVTSSLLKLAVIEIKHNEGMIVIKTQPGLATFVGDYIDQNQNSNILGCIAGENVVFIACSAQKNIKETFLQICEKLFYQNKR